MLQEIKSDESKLFIAKNGKTTHEFSNSINL